MMPNVRGEHSTKKQILFYTILMALCAAAPCFTGLGGIFYGIFSTILSIIFLYFAYRLWKADTHNETILMAKKLFFFSLLYLAAIFGALLIESLVWYFIAL